MMAEAVKNEKGIQEEIDQKSIKFYQFPNKTKQTSYAKIMRAFQIKSVYIKGSEKFI